MLYSSSLGPGGSGTMDREQMDNGFRAVAAGDHEVFARMFLMVDLLEGQDLADLFFGTELRRSYSMTFMRSFERLRELARNCDVGGIIEDSLKQTGFGMLYRRMRKTRPEDATGGDGAAGVPA